MSESTSRFSVTKYFQEVSLELRKVSWPSRQATVQMTALVLGVSTLVAVYLGGLDFTFTRLTTFLLNTL